MAINSIYGSVSSQNRISGLASGMDADELVKSMASSYYQKVTTAFQNKVKMEYKKEAYINFNSSLTSFSNKFLSAAGSNSIKAKSAFNSMSVIFYDSASAASAKITAKNSASPGTHSLRVVSTAHGAKLDSSMKVGEGIDSSGLLSSISGLSELENKDITITFTNPESQQKIDVTVSEKDTLSSLAKKINSAGVGVKLNVSEISGSLSLESTETGKNSKFVFQASASFDGGNSVDLFKELGFEISNDINFDYSNNANYHKGNDAEIVIDGFKKTSSTNSFSLDGMDIDVISASAGDFSFSVETSLDKTKENISGFVDELNNILKEIYDKVNEKPSRNYLPLTDEQKSEMKESEIALWETESRKGTMYGDSKLRNLMQDLRKAIVTPMEGSDLTLADIGITMDKYSAGTAPKVVIDEEKLSNALKKDPLAVENLFTSSKADASFEQQGLASRMSDSISNYNKIMRELEYNTVGFNKKISKLESKLLSETKKLEKKQTEYYSKIAQMETALTNMQSQSSWLSQYSAY